MLKIIIQIIIAVIAALIVTIIVKIIQKKKNNKPIITTIIIVAVLLGILLAVNNFDKKETVISGETGQDNKPNTLEGEPSKDPITTTNEITISPVEEPQKVLPTPPLLKPASVSPETVTVIMGNRQDFFDGRISIHVENIKTGYNNDKSPAVYLLYGDITIIDGKHERLDGVKVGSLFKIDGFNVQFIGVQGNYTAEFRIIPH